MENFDQDKLDQRTSSAMDDSNAMTIEFLRARLLSERSVSRTARQRADELTIRVAELEEQLRIVSLQRKKAEKATVDVLAILEEQGVSDVSEAYYSSSDQDVTAYKKVSNDSKKGGESPVGSKQFGNESEEFSATELESSTVPGRSLSWKGRKDPSRSLEKHKDTSIRRRTSLASMGSSSKHRVGKSCRQIRHRENRLEAAELVRDHAKVDFQENDDDSSSETHQHFTEMGSKVFNEDHKLQNEKVLHNNPVLGQLENEENIVNNVQEGNKDVGGTDMERALEHQAQLIGQYEAMEKAQREWEEKFRENNSSTPDSCDPGNHSDITEERDEMKSQAPYPRLMVAMETLDAQLGAEDASSCNKLSRTHPSSQPEFDSLQSQKSPTPVDNSLNQEFAYPILNGKKENMGSDYTVPSQEPRNDVSHHGDSPRKQPSYGFLPSASNASHKVEKFGNQTDRKAFVPHGTADTLGGVLDSLKQAKLLLQTKMMRVPFIEGEPLQKEIQPSFLHNDAGGKMDIPGGFSGLFRLPTDFALDATKADLLGSGTRLGLTGFYPERGVSLSANGHCLSSRYLESGQSLYGADRYVPSAFMEVGSRISSPQPGFDPYLDISIRNSYPTYPQYRPQLETMPRMLPNEGFPTTFSGSTGRTSRADEFLFHDGYSRQTMYR